MPQAPPPPKKLDWSIDIDSKFGDLPASTAPPLDSVRDSAGPSLTPHAPGGKLHCKACGFENPKVPPEFAFGSELKCAWCGKPLEA